MLKKIGEKALLGVVVNRKQWWIFSIVLLVFISGCVEQSQNTQVAISGMLQAAYPNADVRSQVIEIPAGTVIENFELARIVGMRYTELGLFAEDETELIVEGGNGEPQTMTAPKTVTVTVQVDCRNRGKSGYLDCMVRFKPLGWTEEQELDDTLYFRIATERKNSTFCNYIVLDTSFREACFAASKPFDSSSCENAGNLTYYCYKEVAKLMNDPSYCNNILDTDFYYWCMGVGNRESIYCDKIISRGRGDLCFSEVAVLTGHFFICDDVIDDSDRLVCIQNSVKNSDIEECSSLFFETEADIKACNTGITYRNLEQRLIEK